MKKLLLACVVLASSTVCAMSVRQGAQRLVAALAQRNAVAVRYNTTQAVEKLNRLLWEAEEKTKKSRNKMSFFAYSGFASFGGASLGASSGLITNDLAVAIVVPSLLSFGVATLYAVSYEKNLAFLKRLQSIKQDFDEGDKVTVEQSKESASQA